MDSGDPLERWTAAMLDGDFERAWRETDRIERCRNFAPDRARLLWNGTPFHEKTVLVRCSHGLGDSIQFLRYLPLLRRAAKQVLVEIQPELRDLFTDLNFQPGSSDIQIECMELPYAFRTQLDTIPAEVPYLAIEHIRRARAGFKIRRSPRHLNIGLIWGSGDWNPQRSIRLSHCAPIAAIEGVALHSLQQGPALTQLGCAAFDVMPLSDRTSDLLSAAAAMLQLDLILTVDTVTAHLAGALGRPVWTLLPHDADWRWMRGRQDTPWYPTMRLFRQPSPGDWDAVISRVCCELARRAKIEICRMDYE